MQTANQATLQPAIRPGLGSLNQTLHGKLLLALCASAFVALCAHIAVPLPFTPVPLTFADFAVLLVGLALGPATAFAALVFYLAEGACGLPVFTPSPTALGGTAQLFGHTGGYLMAYPISAAIAGSLSRSLAAITSQFVASLTASATASAFLMLTGTLWLGLQLHLTPARAFALGTAPFLYGQVVKIFAAAGIFSSLHRSHRAAPGL